MRFRIVDFGLRISGCPVNPQSTIRNPQSAIDMNIVYLGSGEFGVPCLDALKASGHDLGLVVTQPPNPSGRGRKLSPTPVGVWAQSHALPCVPAENVNSPEIFERLAQVRPDVMVVIAFGQKIGKALVQLPAKGAINVHASLLPKYRGAAPINWAIVNGETETGVSIITLADKIDAGDILAQSATPIGANETAGELHDRLAHLAAPLLIDTLSRIEAGTAAYTKQDDAKVSFAPKLRKADGFLDFGESAESLARRIRGFWPWPAASAVHVSQHTGQSIRLVIAAAERVPTGGSQQIPGLFDESLNVICGQDRLKIAKIKPAGSELMEFRDFVNGWHVQPGDRLMKVEQ
jgi:methionyl-tRNA formyltransferase